MDRFTRSVVAILIVMIVAFFVLYVQVQRYSAKIARAGARTGNEPAAAAGVPARPAGVPARPAGVQILDEAILMKFLEVRRLTFDVNGSWNPVLAEMAGFEEARQRAVRSRLGEAQQAGLESAGLSFENYRRVAQIVYGTLWKGTAG